MSLSRAWTASWICFMFGGKERAYSGRVLISFWCDSANKNFDFLRFRNIAMQLKFYLSCMLAGPEKFVWRIYYYFFNKIQDGRQVTCCSQELEPLHRFVPCFLSRKHLTLAIYGLDFGVILIIKTSYFFLVKLNIGDSTEGSYGHGKPGKVTEFYFSLKGLGKSWKSILSHGKVMENDLSLCPYFQSILISFYDS